jgi:hypothetical protein
MYEDDDDATDGKNALAKKGESLSNILLACPELDYFDCTKCRFLQLFLLIPSLILKMRTRCQVGFLLENVPL